MMRRAPRSTLFAYTALFRSHGFVALASIQIPPARAIADKIQRSIGAPFGLKDRFVDPAGDELMADQRAMLVEARRPRSEEHTSELQSRQYLVCRLLLEKKML